MGRFLFGSKPSTQVYQDPGVAASNQYFMGLAQQPSMLDPSQKSYYSQLFGTGKRKAQEGAVGRFADLGFGTQRSGQLGGNLSAIESDYELGQATAEQEALERRRANIYSKMGAPQQSVATRPGSPGFLSGLLCWMALAVLGPTPEWTAVAYEVNFGTSWRARLARGMYFLMKPLFKGLLAESRRS